MMEIDNFKEVNVALKEIFRERERLTSEANRIRSCADYHTNKNRYEALIIVKLQIDLCDKLLKEIKKSEEQIGAI